MSQASPTWQERREAAENVRRRRSDDRARRWMANRYAVPYALDGPKVLLGVAWFLGLLGLLLVAPWAVGLLVVPVSGLAALQAAHAWSKTESSDRWVAGGVAVAISISAYFGASATGLVVIAAVGVWAADGYSVGRTEPESLIRFVDIGVRTSVPVGLAGAALVYLAVNHGEAFVALVLLVSAYEAGDFLVGTGADNAFEGPIAGALVVGVLGAGLTLIRPIPFDSATMPLFAGLIAVSSPLGQLFASAILPRGIAWAPALRRMDSYLVGALIWWLTLPA